MNDDNMKKWVIIGVITGFLISISIALVIGHFNRQKTQTPLIEKPGAEEMDIRGELVKEHRLELLYYSLAKQAERKGEFREALEYINKAIELNPENDYIKERAIISGSLKENDKKIRDLERLLENNPDDYRIISDIAVTYTEMGKGQNAIDITSEKINKLPKKKKDNIYLLTVADILSWDKLMRTLKEKKTDDKLRIWSLLDEESRKIIENWESGKKINDKSKEQVVNGINLVLQNEDFYFWESFKDVELSPECEKILKKSLTKLHGVDIQRFNRLLLESVYPDAVASCNYISDYREYLYSARAGAYFQLGKYEEAFLDVNKALKIDPYNLEFLSQKIGFFDQWEKPDKAKSDAKTLTERCRLPKTSDEYQKFGRAYRILGDYKKAVDLLDKSIKLDSSNSAAFMERALYYMETGDKKAASEDLRKVIQLNGPEKDRAEIALKKI